MEKSGRALLPSSRRPVLARELSKIKLSPPPNSLLVLIAQCHLRYPGLLPHCLLYSLIPNLQASKVDKPYFFKQLLEVLLVFRAAPPLPPFVERSLQRVGD